ncbi:MAG: glutathione S-transferase [Caulobacter sp.]|jgi:glutathione S-transferase|nr:glutathione S-transferase [Caulobacter sp.]
MSLALYGHPFSSYTQKAKIALYENATPFEFREIGPDTPQHVGAWLEKWPLAKFPMLVDGDTTVVEASIIIEYLQLKHPGPVRLIPDDAEAALQVRFMDRFFDLHVMDAMQVAVASKIGQIPMNPEDGLNLAHERLRKAYGWLEGALAGKTWACGEAYTMADTAASMSLFYADWVLEITDDWPVTRAYRQGLLKRPSFARCVEEARYFRPFFPLGAPDRD